MCGESAPAMTQRGERVSAERKECRGPRRKYFRWGKSGVPAESIFGGVKSRRFIAGVAEMNAWRRAYTLETGQAGVYNGGMKCIILRAGEREIAVETERKRVRNLNLRVRADGSVHVSAPMRVSEKEVRDFVLSKAEWIATRVAEAEKRAVFSFAESGALPYLGGSLPVVVKEGARTRVTEAADGTVTVAAPSREAADRVLSRRTACSRVCSSQRRKRCSPQCLPRRRRRRAGCSARPSSLRCG